MECFVRTCQERVQLLGADIDVGSCLTHKQQYLIVYGLTEEQLHESCVQLQPNDQKKLQTLKERLLKELSRDVKAVLRLEQSKIQALLKRIRDLHCQAAQKIQALSSTAKAQVTAIDRLLGNEVPIAEVEAGAIAYVNMEEGQPCIDWTYFQKMPQKKAVPHPKSARTSSQPPELVRTSSDQPEGADPSLKQPEDADPSLKQPEDAGPSLKQPEAARPSSQKPSKWALLFEGGLQIAQALLKETGDNRDEAKEPEAAMLDSTDAAESAEKKRNSQQRVHETFKRKGYRSSMTKVKKR